MDQEDPEKRIAQLERQLAEQKHVAGPECVGKRPVVTPEDVHNVAFSKSARGRGGYSEKPGYNEYEVDRYLKRIEATLRDPAASGGVTPADIRNVTFSKPPIGTHGYDQDEVDAFLSRVEAQLKSLQGEFPPVTEPGEPTRCLLYQVGGWSPQPVLAIEVGKDAIRVIDVNSNALIASASLAEVTAKPAQHGGIPVLIVGGPGLETLTIRPPGTGIGQWRRWPKTKKPDYLAMDEDWLTLAEKFGLASDVVEEFTPQTFRDHIEGFIQEFGPHKPLTWRTHLAYGLVCGVLGCLSLSPILLVIGVISLIAAALAWHFGWGFGPNLLVMGIITLIGVLAWNSGWAF